MNPVKNILILAANPKDTTRLRLDEEVRDIQEGLQRSKHRDQFDIRQQWAVRLRDLRRTLLDHEPQIVHFCGHGDVDGLMVEDENGNAILVSPNALAGLFELFTDQVECVVLNACYSEPQANAINKHIKYVIGMSKGIDDKTAIEFAVGFYDALGAGKSIEEAFKFGRNAIQLHNIPEHLVPILIKSPLLIKNLNRTKTKKHEPLNQSSFSPFNGQSLDSWEGLPSECWQVNQEQILGMGTDPLSFPKAPIKDLKECSLLIWKGREFRDGCVKARVWLPTFYQGGTAGLALRYVDRRSSILGLLRYSFVDGGRFLELWQVSGDRLEKLNSSPIPPNIDDNGWYDLSLEIHDRQVSAHIGETISFSVSLPTKLPAGYFGLLKFSGTTVRFDNLYLEVSSREFSQPGHDSRLRQQIDELQRQWDLLSRRLSELESDKILETRSDEKMRLEYLINKLRAERQEVERQLDNLEHNFT